MKVLECLSTQVRHLEEEQTVYRVEALTCPGATEDLFSAMNSTIVPEASAFKEWKGFSMSSRVALSSMLETIGISC